MFYIIGYTISVSMLDSYKIKISVRNREEDKVFLIWSTKYQQCPLSGCKFIIIILLIKLQIAFQSSTWKIFCTFIRMLLKPWICLHIFCGGLMLHLSCPFIQYAFQSIIFIYSHFNMISENWIHKTASYRINIISI